ncbi:malto-oligosyltrehalose trehalohydrolase [Aquipuribacter nitratireducens]|uniref:Malto-oligosyltrehalose trehalohydrolase n=1 Tax=Aquipuribacter nitratireducens TaxID=650104 RepID=A0ABW0GR84_9MICO
MSHTFAVWAPDAGTVDLVLVREATGPDDGHRTTRAMTRADGGWWHLAVSAAGHGSDYLFSVDGGDPVPDPRSAWQPFGVHGPSRLYDPARFRWSDDGWRGRDVRGALHYELHLGTFTPEGTLDAAVGRLDHLVDVGVEVVALMPVAASPGRWGWGYDGVHLFAVHDQYGGPEALQRFVDAAHARGLAVSLDCVYNHLGPSGNYTSVFGPYFTDRHETPWGQAVNLDGDGSSEVRRWICDNALRWFRDFHVDALRLDAVHALVDDSDHHVLAQLADETAALADGLRRPLSLVAESDLNDAVMVTPTAQGGLGMTAQWDDDAHHALHALLTGERQGYYDDFGSGEVLRTVWREAFWHAGRYSPFRGSEWGSPVPAGTSGHRFLAYASNHDQVGNRALGDRPSQTLSPGELAGSLALVLTAPFTPMLFMGEEWGATTPFRFFTDHEDPALAQSVRDGRRREFAEHGWDADAVPDPQDPGTREASVLRWDERDEPVRAGLLAWTRDLVALRGREPDLRDDDLGEVDVEVGPPDESRDDGRPEWLVVHRGTWRVVVVLAAAARADDATPVPLHGTGGVERHWGPTWTEGRTLRLQGPGAALVRMY